jgi:hypothetical protein
MPVTGNNPNPFGLSLSKPISLLVLDLPFDKLRANGVRFLLLQLLVIIPIRSG